MITASKNSFFGGVGNLFNLLALLLVIILISTASQAAVWRVNAASTAPVTNGQTWATAFPTIQSAVFFAASGDEVWVAAGTYTGTGYYEGMKLKSGITLYGGFAGTETLREQRDWTANPTIIDGQGMRICVLAASQSAVDGFTLQHGKSASAGGMSGGTATNCTFSHNTATGAGGGGMNGGTATNCTFSHNTATGKGGGMNAGTAINCVFSENVAGTTGGGMNSGTATNCTFTRNSAYSSGGGIYNGTAINCILWENSVNDTSGTTVSYSCLTTSTAGVGNITVDPCFVSPWADNLLLNANSSCINAGTADGAPSTDLLGRSRPHGAGMDMGAYEYYAGDEGGYVPPPDLLRVHAASSSAAPDGLSWATAFPTLGAAIKHAATGTELWVAQGTYTAEGTAPVVWLKPGMKMYGGFTGVESTRDERGSDPALTVVDGQDARQCVEAGPTGTVDGFTLKDGSAPRGGGMYGGTATNCVFNGNSSHSAGGGMYGGTASNCAFTGNAANGGNAADGGGGLFGGTATNCVFSGNTATSGGGGISSGAATNCTFTGNTAVSGSGGGGGMCYGTATNCTFTGNAALSRSDGGGGGMYYSTAVNCLFTENAAGTVGGGMYAGTATNCTFTRNSAGTVGGGMFAGTATNCTFTRNSADSGGGGIYQGTAINCIIWENGVDDTSGTTVSYSCLSASTAGVGNIAVDPGFVSPWADNLLLSANSPCINAGTADGAPTTDLLGRSRPHGAGMDMGAYEYYAGDEGGYVPPPGLLRVHAASSSATPDGLSWATAFPTLGAAIKHAATGTELWVAQGTYTAEGTAPVVWLKPGMKMYGGFTGVESTRDERGSDPALTVVDGQDARQCVEAGPTSTVDGFTLKSGSAPRGGGMYGGNATNCVFTNNRALDIGGGGMFGGTATNCAFTGNRAAEGGGLLNGEAFNCSFTNNRAAEGGAVHSGTAANCTFTDNGASDKGGGMYGGTATNCTFTSNGASDEGGGMQGGAAVGCVFTSNSAPFGAGMFDGTATDCVFNANTAGHSYSDGQGGGMYRGIAVRCSFTGNSAHLGGGMYDGSAGNCTFVGNHATPYWYCWAVGYGGECSSIPGAGGGMSGGTAVNCTFSGNSATGGIGGGMSRGSAANCTFTANSAKDGGGIYEGTAVNCILWGNMPDETHETAVSYSCLSTETAGAGNIVADPAFVNLWAGDFRLRADSTCIDAGMAEGAPATDLPGRARPQGAGVDMGAYEFYPGDDDQTVLPPAVLRVSAASAAASPDGLTWETAFPTLQGAADRAGFGTEIWVAQGTYTVARGGEVLFLPWPGISVYGGFAGTEDARESRGLDPAATVIDGQASRRCVTANHTALVDGFTLQNGKAGDGGGMYLGTAQNCTFKQNAATGDNGKGGGMCDGTATNCTFADNTATDDNGAGGGMYGGSAANCVFTGNSAHYGAGLCACAATNCAIAGNHTFDTRVCRGGPIISCTTIGGLGGGVFGGTAVNCVIAGNTASAGGGDYSGQMINCTLVGNRALGYIQCDPFEDCYILGRSGGGTHFGTAVNCIFWGNTPNDTSITSTVSYSCLSAAFAGVGNISADPLFADAAAGDYQLQPGSPCIDAGAGEGAPSLDFLGVPRSQGAGWDMGAYESVVSVTVPELTGLARTAARDLIAAARLYVRNESEEYHATIPNDHVIRHTPAAGVQVAQRTPVDLVISKGPEPVPVPDAVGKTQEAATVAITDAGLVVGTVTQTHSLTVPAGIVISQAPAPDTTALPGTAVDLVVSKGGIAVPDVTGQARGAASAALTTAGLAVGPVTEQYSLAVPAGNVISQSIPAGTPVMPGAEVGLVVSTGGIAVPNVVGQAQSAASAALTGAGLVVGTVTQEYSATVPVGAVLSQMPTAGTLVLPGTPVDLAVSRGVQPSVMPEVAGQARAQAEAAVAGAGLTLGPVTEAHSGTVAAGVVISQSPAAGTELAPGTAISLVVSLGPAPLVEGEGEPVDADTARQALSEAYDAVDTNGDGTLSFGESVAAVPGLTQEVFNELDTDANGELSEDELGMEDGSGCAGCRGGKAALGSSRLSELFLLGLGLLGLAVMAPIRRP